MPAELEGPPSPGAHRENKWTANCADLVRFWEENGALPSRYRRGRERELYMWLAYQRRKHQRGKLSQDRITALDVVDCWLTGVFLSRDEWQDRLNTFVATHGRKPSIVSDDRDERALERAVMRHRLDVAEEALHTSMREIGARKVWDVNLAALRQWVGVNARLPKMRAPDPEESRLANFVNRQRRNLAAGQMPADMEALLRTIPGVLEPRPKERPVHEWTALVEGFIARTGRIPHLGAEDLEERSLASARYRHRIGLDERAARAA